MCVVYFYGIEVGLNSKIAHNFELHPVDESRKRISFFDWDKTLWRPWGVEVSI